MAAFAALLLAYPALAADATGSSAAEAFAAADAALARGDGIAAEVALRKALANGTARERVAARMGEAALLQGDFIEARKWLEAGQFAVGDRSRGFHMLGRLEMDEGNFAEAGRALNRALQVTPKDSGLWVDIGRLRYRGGEQLQAMDAAEKAVSLDRANADALEFYGQLVRDSVGFRNALPWFKAAADHAPDNIGALGEYAATLGELGRAKEMLAVTRRMIELSPRHPRAFYLQSILAARAGKYALARRLLMRTGDAYRDMPAAVMLNGILELEAGNVVSAADIFDRLVRRQPHNRRALLLLARTLYQAGQMRELVERFGSLAQHGDASPYLLTLVGRAYEALDDRAAAAPLLDRAADDPGTPHLVASGGSIPVLVLEARWNEDPYRADNVFPFVRALIASGDGQGAVAAAENAVRKFPGSADIRLLAGDAHMVLQDYAGAVTHYRLAAYVRRTPLVLERLMAALAQIGKGAEAENLAGAYLAQHPLDGRAAGWLGEFAAERGDGQKAIRFFSHAINQPQTSRDPYLFAARALERLEAGQEASAYDDALFAYKMQRASGSLTDVLAKVAATAKGGDDPVSRALAVKAMRMD